MTWFSFLSGDSAFSSTVGSDLTSLAIGFDSTTSSRILGLIVLSIVLPLLNMVTNWTCLGEHSKDETLAWVWPCGGLGWDENFFLYVVIKD